MLQNFLTIIFELYIYTIYINTHATGHKIDHCMNQKEVTYLYEKHCRLGAFGTIFTFLWSFWYWLWQRQAIRLDHYSDLLWPTWYIQFGLALLATGGHRSSREISDRKSTFKTPFGRDLMTLMENRKNHNSFSCNTSSVITVLNDKATSLF